MKWNILVKYVVDQLSEDDEKAVEEWIKADPSHKEFVNSIEELWEKSASNKDVDFQINALDAWKQIENKLSASRPIPISQISPQGQHTGRVKTAGRFWMAMKIAAMILFAFGASYFTVSNYFISQPAEEVVKSVEMKEIKTDRGQKPVIVSFSDGTEIFLNAESTLRYPETFNSDNREVYLVGEAYFNVAHLSSSTFTVHAKNSKVEVLGTEFNIKSWQSDDKVEVTVNDGKVAFSTTDSLENLAGKARVILTKGFGSTFADGKISTPKKVDLETKLAWRKGGLVFKQTPMADVFNQLELKYDVNFEVEETESAMMEELFTGQFYGRSLSEVLNVLEVSMNLKFTQMGKAISVDKTE